MLSNCLKSTKNTESKNPKVPTKNRIIMLLSNCVVCYGKKQKFTNKKEASGLLNSFGINAPFLGPLLF